MCDGTAARIASQPITLTGPPRRRCTTSAALVEPLVLRRRLKLISTSHAGPVRPATVTGGGTLLVLGVGDVPDAVRGVVHPVAVPGVDDDPERPRR